jgi:hypothetical protein
VRKNLWNVGRKNVYYSPYFFYGGSGEVRLQVHFIRENLPSFDGFSELYCSEKFRGKGGFIPTLYMPA